MISVDFEESKRVDLFTKTAQRSLVLKSIEFLLTSEERVITKNEYLRYVWTLELLKNGFRGFPLQKRKRYSIPLQRCLKTWALKSYRTRVES